VENDFLTNNRLDKLLAHGGDSRSMIDGNKINKYRCSTSPRPDIIPLGSCTASNISKRGYASARKMLNRLRAVGQGPEFDFTVEESCRHVRSELKFLLTRGEVHNLNVVLTPSGTDAELVSCLLVELGHERDICNIVVGPTELGSGTSLAAACRYFDDQTPAGQGVTLGKSIVPKLTQRIDVYEVAVRDKSGIARPIAVIDEEITEVVRERIEQQNQQVLLHITAHSKTGAHAPSLNVVSDLKQLYPDRLDIVVDAAQGRFSRRGLIRILKQGYLVITTGSKFYGGPPFAGAVLIPENFLARIESSGRMEADFSVFFCQPMFPQNWLKLREPLSPQGNIGLLLRWSAAIEEIRNYYSVPSHLRLAALRTFESMLPDVMNESEFIHLDAVSSPIISDDYERLLQSKKTVFPFRLWNPLKGRYFLFDELREIFLWMDSDLSRTIPDAAASERRALAARLQLGQPVSLSHGQENGVAVLRIANGGVLIAMLAEDLSLGGTLEQRFGWLEDQFLNARRKLEVVAKNFDTIMAKKGSLDGISS